MDEEADSYLKRVSKMKHQHFSKGFASVKRISSGVSQLTFSGKEFDTLHLAYHRTTNILPMKKKRDRSGDDDDDDGASGDKRIKSFEGLSAAPVNCDSIRPNFVDPGVSSLGPERARDSVRSHAGGAPAPVAGQRRVSLIDKWFPGNTLKEATVEVGHAPSAEFVQATVARVTRAREQMILLRSGVEDLEMLLREGAPSPGAKSTRQPAGRREGGIGTDSAITRLIKHVGLASISEALAQFASEPCQRPDLVRKQLKQLMYRKNISAISHSSDIERMQEFLDLKGPETSNLPTLSHFIWLGSVNTTALFIILVQSFLRRIRIHTSPEKDGLGKVVYQATGTVGPSKTSDNDDAKKSKLSSAERDNIEEVTNVSHKSVRDQAETLATGTSLTPSQQKLLSFFRVFMPIWGAPQETAIEGLADGAASAPHLIFSGYGVWLLACLVSLDTPLDPDTDRLVHSWFRTSCEQIRVLGEWKGVHGEQRAALLEALQKSNTPFEADTKYKTYTRIEDIGSKELRALYTIVVILAKFFRQNQNRFIPL